MSEEICWVIRTHIHVFLQLSTSSSLTIAVAFEKLPPGAVSNSTRNDLDATFGGDWPDIEIFSLDAYTGRLNDFVFGAPDLKNYTAVCIALIAPFSRGNISIVSNDTSIHPVVNPHWLTDPRDQEVAVAGFKRARAVFQSAAVKPILIGSEAFPGENVTMDQDILKVIMSSSDTIHHAAGTNRMGMVNDSMAVVDSQGKLAFIHVLEYNRRWGLTNLPSSLQPELSV